LSVVKNLAVSLCIFLLLSAVLIFGYLFMINSTVMSPDYVIDRINETEAVELVDEFVEFESSPETEKVFEEIKDIVPGVEPTIKEGMGVAVYSFYDYLKGKKEEPEIRKTLGEAFLNPEFVDKLLAEISLTELVDIMISEQAGEEGLPEEFIDAMKSVVADLEPDIKEQASEISGPVFDYVLGVTQDMDLTAVLRDTVLNEDFVVPLIEKLDFAVLAEDVISEQLVGQIPPEMDFLTEYIDDAVRVLEPTVKTELTEAAGPILDYLLGDTSRISIEISMADVAKNIENDLRNELFSAPPSEYADLSQSELDEIFDEYVAGRLSEMLPETLKIDESIIGPEIASSLAVTIADAEESLTSIRNELDNVETEMQAPLRTAREYVSYFQLAYTLFMVFIGLMVLFVILLLRDVRVICRRIGVPLFIYGLLEYVGIWVGRYFLDGRIHYPADFPDAAAGIITDITNSVMRPLEIFSLAMMIVGLVLTITSYVYKRKQQEAELEEEVEEVNEKYPDYLPDHFL
jgi:Ca2+/Na+ antiporter